MADSAVTDDSNGQLVAIGNTTTAKNKLRRRLSLSDDIYLQLKAAATSQGKSMTQIANAAIEAYLKAD